LPEDLAAAVAARTADYAEEFAPATPFEEILVGQMGLASARLARCAEMAIADLGRCVRRAELCWERDRRQVIEDLGAKLPKDPARVSRALRRSKQGADWLIERWEGLGEILKANGTWDDAQRRLAEDLLGVPIELRNSGRLPSSSDSKALAALVARQVADLRADQEAVLDELDEADRELTVAGMPMEEDAITARLRKYEASCRRDLHWAQAELRRSRAEAAEASAPPQPRPEMERGRPLTTAAVDYLAKRTEAAFQSALQAVVKPDPTPARPIAPPATVAPRNRRERRALEAKARKSARHSGR
jgi:hypothetical protein